MNVKQYSNATVGCMATFPGRFSLIKPVIESISPQLDHLYIYVNETAEGFPDVSHLGNVTVLDGRDHMGDLSANGKIYPIRYIRDSIILTLDDDFVYPPDYVSTYVDLLEKFNGKCLVTTHGGILSPKVDWYYERTLVMASTQGVPRMQLCSLVGSGTSGFDQKAFDLNPEDFMSEIMVDLRMSIMARMQGLPIWIVPRPAGWLEHIKSDGLWEIFGAGALTHHTDFARGFDWSFDIYRGIANTAIAQAGINIGDLGLDPDLQNGLQTGTVPKSWAVSKTTLLKRIGYMDILLQS